MEIALVLLLVVGLGAVIVHQRKARRDRIVRAIISEGGSNEPELRRLPPSKNPQHPK